MLFGATIGEKMEYYFAPLEGITGYIYRETHFAFYPGIDRYFTPFLVPKEKCDLNTREYMDVLPEHNKQMNVIPQILTNKSEDFLRMADYLKKEFGYKEINLNLGCPSKTVVGKKRGAGFLSVPDQLNCFLEEIFSKSEVNISIKTRIGKDSINEYDRLLEIFQKYPISELIVHPRLQIDYYKNKPNIDVFSKTFLNQRWEICYNGDICSEKNCKQIQNRFPDLRKIMIGRGLLMYPYLVQVIKLRENCGMEKKGEIYRDFNSEISEKEERERLYDFYKTIMEKYQMTLSGEKTVLFKMKELWLYMSQSFSNYEKYWKKMKKAQRINDFDHIVQTLFMKEKLKMFVNN